jgi:hypothetical protein
MVFVHQADSASKVREAQGQKVPEESTEKGVFSMSIAHFVLQGKGGVGKSLVASLLYQYIDKQGLKVSGIDTDPVNSTFAGYANLDVTALDILKGDDIDQRRFDQLMEIVTTSVADHIVIDNGAATFVPLLSYLKQNKALDLLLELGHSILLHTVLTGGQAAQDTATGLKTLASNFIDTDLGQKIGLVVWLNRYFGELASGETKLENFKVYQEYKDKFYAVISIPDRKHSTFGQDLEDMFSRRETFEAAINSSSPLMTRQRLLMFWRDVQVEIEKARLV